MDMNKNYFHFAEEECMLSDYPRIHIGCVAIYNNKVIAKGHNSIKTHPLQNEYNPLRFEEQVELLPRLHAEMSCVAVLKKFKNIDMSKVSFYIYRKRLDNKIGMCRPCKGCMKAIKDLGIKNIYYTTNYGVAHEEII